MLSQIQQYLGRTVAVTLNILVIILVARFFLFEPGQVNGQSMEPTYYDEHRFLVNKFIYLFNPPERFDVIQFYDEKSEQFFVKRVVGLPGETVVIKRGSVFIHSSDGTEVKLEEPYLSPESLTSVEFGGQNEFMVPEHSYFVLGDNRLFSQDSREFGSIHRRLILGKVIE